MNRRESSGEALERGHTPRDFPAVERQAGRILLPQVHQFLKAEDMVYVAEALDGFSRGS